MVLMLPRCPLPGGRRRGVGRRPVDRRVGVISPETLAAGLMPVAQ